MRANRLIVRALVLLGFGGVVGLGAACSATRGQKSSAGDEVSPTSAQDSLTPMRLMYGPPAVRFDPDKPIRQIAVHRTVSGRVTDADSGKVLRGVLVTAEPEASESFAITDSVGRYSIDAGRADSLHFAYLGYLEEAIKIEADTLDVQMKIDSVALNDTMIVMYGVRPASYDFYKSISIPKTKIGKIDPNE
jgi:hypothetical protein